MLWGLASRTPGSEFCTCLSICSMHVWVQRSAAVVGMTEGQSHHHVWQLMLAGLVLVSHKIIVLRAIWNLARTKPGSARNPCPCFLICKPLSTLCICRYGNLQQSTLLGFPRIKGPGVPIDDTDICMAESHISTELISRPNSPG